MELNEPLRTPRLLLRSLHAGDANARYLGWMQDSEVQRYLESRLGTHSLESLRDFIADANRSPANLLLGICLADGRHIGNIKLGPIQAYHRHGAIGLLIGERDSWGRGYAAEAIAGISAHAFGVLGLEKLYAGCYASNQGSCKAFLRAGYVEESRQKGMWTLDDRREDNIQLGLTRDDWRATQGLGAP